VRNPTVRRKRLTRSDSSFKDCEGMTQELKSRNVAVRSDSKVQVKVGSGSVIVEQSELHNLIEALSELRSLVARDRALMNVGSA
jgi:hypothetical protein